MNRSFESNRPLPPMQGDHRQNGQAPKPKPKATTANRWSEYNDFVDCTKAKVGVSAAAVWYVLFRDARDRIARIAAI